MTINYLQLLQKGLRFVVRSALQEVAKTGSDDAHFYITFKTNFPGVSIPESLSQKYPNIMTIVMQHEFWNLQVYEEYFSVDLSFDDHIDRLEIPFASIYKFEDPSEPFVLDFMVEAKENSKESFSIDSEDENNVININDFRNDDFRKKI
jgi:hypothetical protein